MFMGVYDERKLQNAVFYHPGTRTPMDATIYLHCRYFFFTEEKALGSILIIAVFFMALLIGFLLYHFNFAVKNMTTNEAYKRPTMGMDVKAMLKT